MARSYPVKKIEINGIELVVSYSLYEEPMTETNPPYSEVEITEIRYNGRDVTELINAFDLEEQIISRL